MISQSSILSFLKANHSEWFDFILECNKEILQQPVRSSFFYFSACFYQEVAEYNANPTADEAGDILAFAALLLHLADENDYIVIDTAQYELCLDDCLRFFRGDNNEKFADRIVRAVLTQVSRMPLGFLEEAIQKNHNKLRQRVEKFGSLKKDR